MAYLFTLNLNLSIAFYEQASSCTSWLKAFFCQPCKSCKSISLRWKSSACLNEKLSTSAHTIQSPTKKTCKPPHLVDYKKGKEKKRSSCLKRTIWIDKHNGNLLYTSLERASQKSSPHILQHAAAIGTHKHAHTQTHTYTLTSSSTMACKKSKATQLKWFSTHAYAAICVDYEWTNTRKAQEQRGQQEKSVIIEALVNHVKAGHLPPWLVRRMREYARVCVCVRAPSHIRSTP